MKLRRHLIDAAVPTIFGLLVSLLIFLAGDFRIPRILGNIGTDLGMRIFAEPGLAPGREFFRSDTPFVFLDVDYTACQRLREPDQSPAVCENPAYPPAQILERLVQISSDARLIVVDFPLPETDTDDADSLRIESLNKVLTNGDGPIVLAPAPLRPLPSPLHLQLTGEKGLNAIAKDGRLRLAAFVAWDDASTGDGVLRDYPPVVFVDELQQSARLGYLPTAPFLAAMLATTSEEPAETSVMLSDGLFYGGPEPCSSRSDWVALWSDRAGVDLTALCDRRPLELSEYRRERIMFTVNSLAVEQFHSTSSVEAGPSTRDVYYGLGSVSEGMLYRHYPLSVFFPDTNADGWTRMSESLDLSGQIVVIGTSSIAGYDWHATPLGLMSGAEVIINATRAYKDFANRNQLSPLPIRLASLVLQIAIAFIAALAMGMATDRLIATTRKLRWGRIWSGIVIVVGFLVGLAASLVLAGYATYLTYSYQPDTTTLDFLTPVLSVFFVEFVIISAAALLVIRRGLEMLVLGEGALENKEN